MLEGSCDCGAVRIELDDAPDELDVAAARKRFTTNPALADESRP